jgi:hypothetical protein
MPIRKVPNKRSPYYTPPVYDVDFTIGVEATNAITVNLQVLDDKGGDLEHRAKLDWFLSSDAGGDTLVATAASGGVAAGTDGWLAQTVTGKMGTLVTEADGDADVVITDTSARTVYLNVIMPDGRLKTSEAITFA